MDKCTCPLRVELPAPPLQIHPRRQYRSTIAGSLKNYSTNKKRKNYEIMKT